MEQMIVIVVFEGDVSDNGKRRGGSPDFKTEGGGKLELSGRSLLSLVIRCDESRRECGFKDSEGVSCHLLWLEGDGYHDP